MKLYVWTGFSPDSTDGLAFAVAESEAEARRAVAKALGVEPYFWGDLTIHPVSETFADAAYGGC